MRPDLDPSSIRAAADRIGSHVARTPARKVENWGIWVKCENRQITGSFKLRGALNKVLGLTEPEAARGVVAASAGNHGQGVAYAARLRGIPAAVVVPRGAVAKKIEAIRALGAEVIFAEGGYAEAEWQGLRLAEARGAIWVSPYNDLEVIRGQATVGLELAEQLGIDSGGAPWEVWVPVGGGGLVCGIGASLRHLRHRVRVIGVQPEASPYLHVHFHGGDMQQVQERPTAADGLAGAIEPGSVTLDLLPALADDMQLVSEEEIWQALRVSSEVAGEVVEPSAAAALAGCLRSPGSARKVVVLSGGNLDPRLLKRRAPEESESSD